MRARSMLILMVLVTAAPAALSAQQRDVRFVEAGTERAALQSGWSIIRVAKWTTLLASTGAAAYGFTQNRSADREYEAIERECNATPALCTRRPETDEYTNVALEQRYQNVVERDDRARLALLAGQLGIAASVIMFIIDLPDQTTPDDIPYDPNLRFNLRSDGGAELGFRIHTAHF